MTNTVARKKYHIKTEDIYNKDVLIEDLIYNSFHLPVDVLTDPRYKIMDPVIVDPNLIPTQYIEQVKIDGSNFLFWNAKRVALSVRIELSSGEEIVVGRIWFGKEIKS